MPPCLTLSIMKVMIKGTIERILKLLQEDNLRWTVAKDVDYSQSAASKI